MHKRKLDPHPLDEGGLPGIAVKIMEPRDGGHDIVPVNAWFDTIIERDQKWEELEGVPLLVL